MGMRGHKANPYLVRYRARRKLDHEVPRDLIAKAPSEPIAQVESTPAVAVVTVPSGNSAPVVGHAAPVAARVVVTPTAKPAAAAKPQGGPKPPDKV